MTQPENIRDTFIRAGQEHIFQYWEELTQIEKSDFLSQLSKFPDPVAYINRVQEAIKYSAEISKSRSIEPLPSTSYDSTLDSDLETLQKWQGAGYDLIKNGKVGVILMAGGQGTRLGSSDPKGFYDVGLPSHKSLFQLQCERILKLQDLVSSYHSSNNNKDEPINSIPLYIMTSDPTRIATENYFKENNFFGLDSKNVIFFSQGTLPALSLNGDKFLLETKNKLVESPDGNGGLYRAILNNNLIEDFDKRGIKHIHMYCVDNVLVKVSDPLFLGYSALNEFDVATKVVRKRDASESVGLIVLDSDKNSPCVIEYSEISKELSEKKDLDGKLSLRAANIVNHYYNVDFLKKSLIHWVNSKECLPYHIAKKKIGYFDSNENKFIKPTENNGIKMEQFIFDVFPTVKLSKFGCLEVERFEEFSPLKNAPGSQNDSPETCKSNLLKRSTKWLIDNGAILENENDLVEVLPSTSYAGEGLSDYKGVLLKNNQII